MLPIDDLKLRRSEITSRLNIIAGMSGDALTDEVRSESEKLGTELDTVEVRYRAALRAQPGPEVRTTIVEDSEVRERRAVRNKTGLRDYLTAACSGAPVSGAAAEFNASCNVPAGDHVPRELFEGPARELRQATEHRAITPGPAIDGAPQATIPFLFEASVVSTLGLDFPAVESGAVQIPSITTAPPSSVVAKDGTALSTAGAYSLVSRSPKRLTGQVQFRVEDLAVHPTLDSDLSMSLQDSLSNRLDEQAINGTGGDDLLGMFEQATNVSATATTDTFPLGLAAFASLVDGRYSRGMGDLRGIVGSATFGAYMALYHGGSGDVTLFEKLRSLMGSLEVSDRMPAVASGAQKGIVSRTAGAQPIRIYTWNSIQLIRDTVTGAADGKVTVTALQLVSDPYIPYGVNQVVEVHRDLS